MRTVTSAQLIFSQQQVVEGILNQVIQSAIKGGMSQVDANSHYSAIQQHLTVANEWTTLVQSIQSYFPTPVQQG